jgi:hypothetical protein
MVTMSHAYMRSLDLGFFDGGIPVTISGLARYRFAWCRSVRPGIGGSLFFDAALDAVFDGQGSMSQNATGCR